MRLLRALHERTYRKFIGKNVYVGLHTCIAHVGLHTYAFPPFCGFYGTSSKSANFWDPKMFTQIRDTNGVGIIIIIVTLKHI